MMPVPLGLVALVALGGCAHPMSSAEMAASWAASDRANRARLDGGPLLALGAPVHGTTDDRRAHTGAICGVIGEPDARLYRFVPPRTASYQFTVRAEAPVAFELASTQPGSYSRIGCNRGPAFELRAALRQGVTYTVGMVGNPGPRNGFELAIGLDESARARIRPEDPEIAGPLITAAPRLAPGRTFGVFASVAAGPRAACGGTGSGAVYTVDVATAGTLAVHALAQFPVAIELRDRAGSSLGCAAGAASRFEATVTRHVAPGSYVVVLDATDVAPELFPYPERADPGVQASDVTAPGAAVQGGFTLDMAVTP